MVRSMTFFNSRMLPGPGYCCRSSAAAGVNPVDWKIRRGDLRPILWLRFPYIPGGDIAGEVVAVGQSATRFKPGDAVVAFVDMKRGGGYAEVAVVKESAAALAQWQQYRKKVEQKQGAYYQAVNAYREYVASLPRPLRLKAPPPARSRWNESRSKYVSLCFSLTG